jgi:hypothetical protein
VLLAIRINLSFSIAVGACDETIFALAALNRASRAFWTRNDAATVIILIGVTGRAVDHRHRGRSFYYSMPFSTRDDSFRVSDWDLPMAIEHQKNTENT